MAIFKNRLVKIFEDFANNHELHFKGEESNMVSLGVPIRGQLVHVKFNFNQTEDSYEFGTPLTKVDSEHQSTLALEILRSKPIRGLTERFVGKKFYVLGSRDGLKHLPDEEVQRAFRNDIARVSEYYTRFKNSVDEDS